MEKSIELTIIAERGIYVSRETSLLSEDDDFILTTDIDLYARLSQDYSKFVGFANALNHVDLQGLFCDELFNRLIMCVAQRERNAAYFCLGTHMQYITKIYISDSALAGQELAKGEDWISMLLLSERPRFRLEGIRERILIVYEHLRRGYTPTPETWNLASSGSRTSERKAKTSRQAQSQSLMCAAGSKKQVQPHPIERNAVKKSLITVDFMFEKYTEIFFRDTPRRDEFIKALSLTTIPVVRIYDPARKCINKKSIEDCSRDYCRIEHLGPPK